MLIKVKEIMGSNYETFERIWNDNLTMYKTLITGDSAYIDKFSTFMLNKLKIKISVIKEFESLYDLETSTNMLNDLITDFMIELFNESFTNSLMVNSKWLDFDNLGNTSTAVNGTNENTMSYSGYNITNQAGQYSKNNGTNTVNQSQSGGMSRLQYIGFLQSYTSEKCVTFISSMKKYMLKLIY